MGTSVRIASIPAEIQAKGLMSTSWGSAARWTCIAYRYAHTTAQALNTDAHSGHPTSDKTKSITMACSIFYGVCTHTTFHTSMILILICSMKNKTNSVAFSPQANYTDWATVTWWQNLVPTFADREVSRGQRGRSPTVVNLGFPDWSRYFSFK
jgi:hypothetical protein